MLCRYPLILALILSPLPTASSDSSPICFADYTGLRNTTFSGTAEVLTESYSDGVKVVIKVERILSDPTQALRLHANRIEGYLPSPLCVSAVLIGKQQMWAGSQILDGIAPKFIVQIVRHSEADPCLQKQCHPGAICETWNDIASSMVAVCVCLSLRDLETAGKCQLTTGEVCASDGNIYPNTCSMLRASCLQQTELSIISWTAVNQKDCQQQA
ncbi:unnamed protein product, partial [Hydatigera taeniaeformis]|uniref:Kazal-like domain-containing protein n=1 Tax=Hydatigena taeniaeformis TaxID=6205 RepID=A0A0R3X6T3_HYDTA